jgi:hypothetical protein
MAATDLRGFYTQLPVHDSCHDVLGIRWRRRHFVYASPPFGCGKGKRCEGVPELHRRLSECQWCLDTLLELLAELGVGVSEEKTVAPTQRLKFLGIVYNTVDGEVEVDAEYQERVASALADMEGKQTVPVAALDSVVGKLHWIGQVAPRVRWWARIISGARPAGGKSATLNRPMRRAMVNLRRYLSKRLHSKVLRWHPALGRAALIRCDSSGPDGYGGHYGERAFARDGQDHAYWAKSHNMAAKETQAVVEAVKVWGPELRGQVMVVATDNQAAALACNHMHSGNSLTHAVLGELHEAVEQTGVLLIVVQVMREHNVVADFLTHLCLRWDGFARLNGKEVILSAHPFE